MLGIPSAARLRLALCLLALVMAAPADAHVAGLFRTATGTTANYEYQGDGIQSSTVPLDATINLSHGHPTQLTVTLHRPIIGALADGTVLQPIASILPLVVTASSASGDDFAGTLLDTQYFYEWQFDAEPNGDLLWNGRVMWFGGRFERTSIVNARLIPIPEPATLAPLAAGALAIVLGRPVATRRQTTGPLPS